MYWVEPGASPPRLFRASLDGTDKQTVVETTNGAAGVALDVASGKVYWTESVAPGVSGKIRRANLDGTGVEDLVTLDVMHPAAITLDLDQGKIYWTDLRGDFDGLGEIVRSDLDGANVESILSGIDEANGLSLDPIGDRIFWTDLATHRIQSAALDGTDVVDVVTGLDTPTSISLDPLNSLMYWTDSALGGQANRIERAAFDGSGREIVVSGVGQPWGIAVAPEPSTAILMLVGWASLHRQRRRIETA